MENLREEIEDLQATQLCSNADPWNENKVAKSTVCIPIRLRGGAMRIGPNQFVKERTKNWIDNESTVGFEWNCYYSSHIIVSGIGTLWMDEKLITQRDLMPKFWRDNVYDKRFFHQFDVDREKNLPISVINEPCISYSTWGFDTYGHVILDQLPRLCAAQGVINNIKVLVRSDTPEWSLDMMRFFGVSDQQIIRFNPRLERVRLARGVFPAYGRQDGMIHPVVAPMFDIIHGQLPALQNRTRRVFLSRSGLSEDRKRARNCVNEGELAEIARNFGYWIVCPERMSFIEQIAMFRSTKLVAGLVGSALHTSIFSDSLPTVAFVGFNAMAQPQISRLRGQNFAVFDEGVELSQAYEVPASDFRHFLQSIDQTH